MPDDDSEDEFFAIVAGELSSAEKLGFAEVFSWERTRCLDFPLKFYAWAVGRDVSTISRLEDGQGSTSLFYRVWKYHVSMYPESFLKGDWADARRFAREVAAYKCSL